MLSKEFSEIAASQIAKNRELIGLFLKDEFHGQFTVEGLLAAIKQNGITVPSAAVELDALNQLLAGDSLHKFFPMEALCEEAQYIIKKEENLNKYARIYLNRLILESVYPLKCPKKRDRSKNVT